MKRLAMVLVFLFLSGVARAESPGVVAMINYKLGKYVKPTGKCGVGESEQMTTYYWSGTHVATGARFNPHGLTVAHKTLPFGTQLMVRNPRNGRSTSVTVNDRGPFTLAKFDLALGAAKALGMDTSMYLCYTGPTGVPSADPKPRIKHHHQPPDTSISADSSWDRTRPL